MSNEIRTHSSTSNIIRLKLYDSTSTVGAGITGLGSASSGLIISTIADNEATATAYTVAASNVETITTLGTYAAPTAGKCRFKEVDATNHPGEYELQFADARFSVASSEFLMIAVSGAADLVEKEYEIQLTAADFQDSADLGLTALTGHTPQSGDTFAKFTGITLLANWIRAALRSDAADATALTEINSGGGTYDEATDASEAIRNKIDTLAAAPGTGARPFVPSTITVVAGSGASGTADDMANDDANIYTVNDSAGTLTLDLDYQLEPDTQMIQYLALVDAQGNTDDLDLQFYDQVGLSWDSQATITGDNGVSYENIDKRVLSKYTDDSGLFQVRITGTGLTAATLTINVAVGYGISTIRSVGYAKGRIWYDDTNGVPGSTAYINGTADTRKCSVWSDVMSLSSSGSTGITDIQVINGSSVTLTQGIDNYSIFGDNYALALAGQSVSGAYFQGAEVSGIGLAATDESHFEGCDIGTISIQNGHFDFCGFSGTVTNTLAGDYNYHNCYSKVAGAGAPTFTKTAGQAVTLQFRNWAGGIILSGLEAGDTVTVGGTLGTVTLNGADAAVEIRGTYKSIVNNLTGSPTVNSDGALQVDDIVDRNWDEPLTSGTHNVANSGGRRIRAMQEFGGYEGGGVWVNTITGTAGTEDYENGTVQFPALLWSDAQTIATSINYVLFAIENNSTITLDQTTQDKTIIGHGWTLNLNGQDISDTHIKGATVSGVATGALSPDLDHCTILNVTLPPSVIHESILEGTVTVGSAGKFYIQNCLTNGAYGIDFGAAVGNSEFYVGGLCGDSVIDNMGQTGTDFIRINGSGKVTFNASCVGGTASVGLGIDVVNNGSVTVTYSDVDVAVTDIVEDTADMQPKLGTPAADISADIAAVKGDTSSILIDTADIQPKIGTPSVDLSADIAAIKADTGAIVIDTNELQGDWTDGGRLDLILDAINGNTSTIVLGVTERNAIADAMLDRDMSTGTDSGTEIIRTVRQALRSNRNKASIVAGVLTVTKEDDTTPSWTAAVTTTAGNPISEIDPT